MAANEDIALDGGVFVEGNRTIYLFSLDEVIVPDERIRKEFPEKEENDLIESIEQKCLFHAPVFRFIDKVPHLVIGERRLRAMKKLAAKGVEIKYNNSTIPLGYGPFIALSSLSEDDLIEAELEENTRRLDLTVVERAKVVARLHQLRVKQHGESNHASKEGWTRTDTATELAGRAARKNEINDVSVDLIIAKHADDPLVAAAKDRKEALRAIRDQTKTNKRNEALKSFDPTKSKHTLIQGNCYEILTQDEYLNRYDVILTDPPYGIDIDKVDTFDNDRHEYDDSEEAFNEICDKLPELTYRIAKGQAHLYVFCDIRRWPDLFVAFEISGWEVWPRPLIWDKGNIGSYGNIERGFRSTYDAILFANKGKRPVTAAYRDVFSVNQSTSHTHPAGKPPQLYADILRCSVYPGNEVIDMYCGGGPIFPAAEKNHCIATGIEKHDKYFPMSVETLKKLEKK